MNHGINASMKEEDSQSYDHKASSGPPWLEPELEPGPKLEERAEAGGSGGGLPPSWLSAWALSDASAGAAESEGAGANDLGEAPLPRDSPRSMESPGGAAGAAAAAASWVTSTVRILHVTNHKTASMLAGSGGVSAGCGGESSR